MLSAIFGFVTLPAAAVACTTILLGKDTNTLGAPLVTTTNDCVTCEARVGYVPARTHPVGATRPVGTSICFT